MDWVTEDVIRKRFNAGGYWLRVQSGQLVDLVKKASHPSVPPAGEPHCTQSQIVCYYTHSAKLVAEVHQYLRPDGKLGASGLPDPKRLFLDDRILAVRSRPNKGRRE